jgi:hypothetical protein
MRVLSVLPESVEAMACCFVSPSGRSPLMVKGDPHENNPHALCYGPGRPRVQL